MAILMTASYAEELFRSTRPITAKGLSEIHLDMLFASPVPLSVRDDIRTASDALKRGKVTEAEQQAIERVVKEFNNRRSEIMWADKFEHELRAFGQDHQPNPSWQRQVFARIDREAKRRRRLRVLRAVSIVAWIGLVVLAAVAVGACIGFALTRWL